ncbi:MAG: hypothetical protein WC702_04110 [Patescibacteria group bacterium]|jgi:hypothetical protein
MELSEVASILESLREKVGSMETKVRDIESYMVKKDHLDGRITEIKDELSDIKAACAK